MCEYLRPVVALEWLKACCTDNDHVDVNLQLGRNTEHDDSKELPVMGDVEDMELSDTTQVTGDH